MASIPERIRVDQAPSGRTGGPGAAQAKALLHRRLGPYRIVEKIGEGGMGVVYKAHDDRLNRSVAVKVLAHDTIRDSQTRQRFAQEARTASALNHPNIVHIYDVGSEDGYDFIAMEYVQGQPLSRAIHRKPLDWRTAVQYGIQIAGALDAAHAAGILHRDLKPGNIMVAEGGAGRATSVKVLDFGLAKLLEPPPREPGEDPDLAQTRTEFNPTSPGIAVGTPLYMSPEQASGRPLDPRSDIFAFGTVMYEMITGETPFQGDSHAAVMASLLRDEPKPPTHLLPQTPVEVERAILRCLRKDPERRFQSMREVRLALEDVLEQPVTLASQIAVAAVPARKRPTWPLILAAAAVIAVLAGAAWWRFGGFAPRASDTALTRLTSDSGLSTDPALSADGKLLAFASDRSGEGNLSIWLRQTGGGEPVRLTHGGANDSQPAFSPDGTRIAFHSDRDGGGIYEISALGGTERRLVEGGYGPRFSPDGKWIAYWSGSSAGGAGTALHVLDPAQGLSRDLAPGFAQAAWPVWSPDGKYLLFRGRKTRADGEKALSLGWWVVPTGGGAPTQITIPTAVHDEVGNGLPYGWTADRVVYTAAGNGSTGIFDIPLSKRNWQVTGTPHRLTPGMTNDGAPSLAADGRMAFASLAGNVDVYSLQIDADRGKLLGQPERLTRDVADDFVPSVSLAGGRLAFSSRRAGEEAVWTKDLSSGREAPLLKPSEATPFLSADGTVVFGNEGSSGRILAVPFDGGRARTICQDCGSLTAISADGNRLLFTDYSPHSTIGVYESASGRKAIIRHALFSAFPRAISADGRWIAAVVEKPAQIFVVPFHETRPTADVEWVPVTSEGHRDNWPRFSPGGGILYFMSDRDGHECIWAQRLEGAEKRPSGEPFAVAHFHGTLSVRPLYKQFSVSRDRLAISLEERTGNIWMSGTDRR
jgi:serine/threonine protein kinase/Tol biopolymer transport system component